MSEKPRKKLTCTAPDLNEATTKGPRLKKDHAPNFPTAFANFFSDGFPEIPDSFPEIARQLSGNFLAF